MGDYMHYWTLLLLSLFSRVRLCVTLWTLAHQAPLTMGFSRQEYRISLPCPPPGHLPDPGIKPAFLISSILARGFFTTTPPRKTPIYNAQLIWDQLWQSLQAFLIKPIFSSLHKKWQPTSVFLPRKLHGQRSLVGYNPWCHRVWLNLAYMHTFSSLPTH